MHVVIDVFSVMAAIYTAMTLNTSITTRILEPEIILAKHRL